MMRPLPTMSAEGFFYLCGAFRVCLGFAKTPTCLHEKGAKYEQRISENL